MDVYEPYKAVCDKIIGYLQAVNDVLEGTPFKIAYRTRNEFLLYVVNNLPYNKDENGSELVQEDIIVRALDEITSMKILSRIEGDESKVSESFLKEQKEPIESNLYRLQSHDPDAPINTGYHISSKKLDEMIDRLKKSGYTSFWS